MVKIENIYIVKSSLAKSLKDRLEDEITQTIKVVDIEELKAVKKNIEGLIFIPPQEEILKDIKNLRAQNPNLNFIIYSDKNLKTKTLISFIQTGIVESINIKEQQSLKTLLTNYLESKERELDCYHNVINSFKDIGIVSYDLSMVNIFLKILKISQSNSTVLIYGENGTGKELIAKSIHYFSNRRQHRFVGVNTGAIPENLLEVELFGHVKGAFTGAHKDRVGKFEHAHRGTIFLDEISNMPMSLQVKLLRVLQERTIEKVGDNQSIQIDTRIITATNKVLSKMVEEETFREDLFYRLNVIPINLPPLRKRKKDIPLLANYFILKFCSLNNLKPPSLSVPATKILKNYNWPGNIRQLENLMERMIVLNPHKSLLIPADVPEEIKMNVNNNEANKNEEESIQHNFDTEFPDEGISLNTIIKNLEKKLILQSLEKTNWNKQQAAKLLDIKRTTLIEKLKKIQK